MENESEHKQNGSLEGRHQTTLELREEPLQGELIWFHDSFGQHKGIPFKFFEIVVFISW